MDIVNNPSLYKGLAHDENERKALGLRGILPAAVRTSKMQIELVHEFLREFKSNLGKYKFLRQLQDTNERLFFQVLCGNLDEFIPIVYTPTVGEATIKYSRSVFKTPKGLFITYNDRGSVQEVLSNWPDDEIKSVTVTDGERILGLGDMGANGMSIPIGKTSLCTAAAKINPAHLLGALLDVGTNNKELLEDPYYIGLRQERVNGQEYDEFIDEFMQAITSRYGKTCLIMFEDFGNKNALRLLNKYKNDYFVFNDDIQGTSAVVLAGLLNAIEITKIPLDKNIFLFVGAGMTSLGIANLLEYFLKESGVPDSDLRQNIWMTDINGLVTDDRTGEEITEDQKPYMKNHPRITSLEEIVMMVKPTVLIGACSTRGVFTTKVLNLMLRTCSSPVIFALSNPDTKAECSLEEAMKATGGKCIYASGTAFPIMTYNGIERYCNQSNNIYIFPAFVLALTACQAKFVDNKLLAVAAKALSNQVSAEEKEKYQIFPPINLITISAFNIATQVAQYIFDNDLSGLESKPDDVGGFLISKQYDFNY